MSGMKNLDMVLINLRLTTKQLNKQAARAGKDEQTEKAKLEKAIKQGNNDIARIHAQNTVRKQNEKLNLLQLASRVDAVASRVNTARTMQNVTMNMAKVNRSLDVATKSMSPERIATVMVDFEKYFENIDSATDLYQNITDSATATSAPQEDIDRLMAQAADKAGVELSADLQEATPAKTKINAVEQEEDGLTERLRALRN